MDPCLMATVSPGSATMSSRTTLLLNTLVIARPFPELLGILHCVLQLVTRLVLVVVAAEGADPENICLKT